VRFYSARALTRNVHRLGAVTVTAFQGIVRFHPRPFVLRKLKAVIQEFVARIDGAENLSLAETLRLIKNR
jgi:hypothetical protein